MQLRNKRKSVVSHSNVKEMWENNNLGNNSDKNN